MNIRIAKDEEKEVWDSFVDTNNGSFFHYFDWKKIFEVNDWKYIPLIVEDEDSNILCIFPIWIIRKFFSNNIVSLPEGSSGGIVFRNGLTYDDKSKLFDSLLKFIDENFSKRCGVFTLRENLMKFDFDSNDPTKFIIDKGFSYKYDPSKELPCTFLIELKKPFETHILHNLWGRKIRQKVRKAIEHGVIIKEDFNLEYKDEFLKLMNYFYKRHKSTLRTNEEIIKRLTVFKNQTRLFLAFIDEKLISALLCYYSKNTIYLSKIPNYDIARKHNVNLLLFHDAIKDACDKGYNYVEFGITNDPTQALWKEHLKGIRVPVRLYEKEYSKIRFVLEQIRSRIIRCFRF